MKIKTKIFFANVIAVAIAFVLLSTSCVFVPKDFTAPDESSKYPEVGGDAVDPNLKRGLCYNSLTETEAAVLSKSKVSWVYNWGESPSESEEKYFASNKNLSFMPMAWGKNFDEVKLRKYLSAHPETKYLLTFNEPMMTSNVGGCNMSPENAAKLWPRLEKIATDYNLFLVSPALTYGYEKIEDGKIYGTPESWLDEFILEYKKMFSKKPRFDYLALHCYMDYSSATLWFCNTYATKYSKKVFLTEFCAWDGDQNQTPHQSAEEQCKSMIEKIDALDKNKNVAYYAWFMSHGNITTVPYNSIFDYGVNDANRNGRLTELGKKYCELKE